MTNIIPSHKEERSHSIWHKNINSEEGSVRIWKPKGSVWFKKNDDSELGQAEAQKKADENITATTKEIRSREISEKLRRRYKK